jgi:hypothetical protein
MKYLLILSIISLFYPRQDTLQGAWEYKNGDTTFSMIVVDDYMSLAMYNLPGKKFYGTMGGTVTGAKGEISGTMEFNSIDKSTVGKPYRMSMTRKGKTLLIERAKKETWKMIDDGNKNLAGNWRITQREQNGTLTPIHITGPRKTIKMLSGTRFHWAAINTETGEFSGTGGGRYSLADGKYTEMIDFFSRDSSRVGMSLSFNARLDQKDWYHSGKSSKGDPINEVWSRR